MMGGYPYFRKPPYVSYDWVASCGTLSRLDHVGHSPKFGFGRWGWITSLPALESLTFAKRLELWRGILANLWKSWNIWMVCMVLPWLVKYQTSQFVSIPLIIPQCSVFVHHSCNILKIKQCSGELLELPWSVSKPPNCQWSISVRSRLGLPRRRLRFRTPSCQAAPVEIKARGAETEVSQLATC